MVVADLQLPIQIEELRAILKKHGVISASLFGSYARGEARNDGDLDLLVHLRPLFFNDSYGHYFNMRHGDFLT